MSEGIVVLQKGVTTFSNNAFKQIIQSIKFEDNEEEIDIFKIKLFSIYREKENLDIQQKKKKKNKRRKSIINDE